MSDSRRKRYHRYTRVYVTCILVLHIVLIGFQDCLYGQVIPVVVTDNGNGTYTLLRDGVPYTIRGGGGQTISLQQEMVKRGGNSIRTWGVSAATKEVLDSAYANGLTVLVGLWVQKETDGFDYDDTVAVHNQLESFRTYVLQYKDHPALLAWGIGNEVELGYSNLKVWNAINDISEMIHQEDGNHPTLTVTAGISTSKANTIAERAPDLDMLGVNSYGGISSVDGAIQGSNLHKPYIITEWGVNGTWEVSKTTWGAPLEPTSTEKSALFKQRYESYIKPNTSRCPGNYAFLWGSKFEGTETWFGLFVNNEPTEMLDVLQYEWTGSWPENRAPEIGNVTLNEKTQDNSVMLPFSDDNYLVVEASDPDGDSLQYECLVLPESGDEGVEPIPGATFEAIPGVVREQRSDTSVLKFGSEQNHKNLRAYVFVRDGHGHVSTATFPFRTEIIDLDSQEWYFAAKQDAYVRDGAFSDTKYGVNDKSHLIVQRSSVEGSTRQIYLQFDLTDAPRFFGEAWLELYGNAPADLQVQVYGFNNSDWDEETITWNNKISSSSGVLISRVVSTQTRWYQFNLTDYLAGQFDNNNRSINLIMKGYISTDDGPAVFSSKDVSSNQARMHFTTETGIEQVHFDQLHWYPNPVHEKLTVEFLHPSPVRCTCSIYTAEGKKVLQETIRPGQHLLHLEVSALPDGLYFMVVRNSRGVRIFSDRFVKA